MGTELDIIAFLKSGIHGSSYLVLNCFLIVMLVHQVVANVLLLFFVELPNELTHRIMGSCLHRPHDFVKNVSQTCQAKCFFTYLAAENKRHSTNCSTFSAFLFFCFHFDTSPNSMFQILIS
jgi:hypothetical protein